MQDDDLYELLDEGKALDKWHAKYVLDKKTKKQPVKISEHTIQKAIADQLDLLGYMVVRVNSSTQTMEHGTRLSSYRVVNINATAGHADLAVYRDGRVWMLEVKGPKGRISPSQDRFSTCCLRYGVPYGIVRSVNDAIEFVRNN